jgi:hypothetical protein
MHFSCLEQYTDGYGLEFQPKFHISLDGRDHITGKSGQADGSHLRIEAPTSALLSGICEVWGRRFLNAPLLKERVYA